MKKLAGLLLLSLLSALPLAASNRADASFVTFFYVKTTAEMTTLKDALFWHYNGVALDGLVATAARVNVNLTSVGGGNSELAISMPLAAGDTWVAALAATQCPSASTTQARRDCLDPMIRQDLKRIWDDYQRFLAVAAPVAPDI